MRSSLTTSIGSFARRCLRFLRGSQLDHDAHGAAGHGTAAQDAAAGTRRLAVILASVLSGTAAALVVPLLWPNASLLTALLVAVGSALWPVLVGLLRSASEHRHWVLYSGVAVSSPLAVIAHLFYHPALRVLNMSDRSLTISVDGQPVFTLPATSLESPRAGAELNLSLGRHVLTAQDSRGMQLGQQVVQILAGQTHLYAPLSGASCFALETTHYGRAGVEVTRDALTPGAEFWVLPTSVDLWLTPAPESGAGSRWSGGTLTALRHGPCPGAGTPTPEPAP
jgi:hypothetical protein